MDIIKSYIDKLRLLDRAINNIGITNSNLKDCEEIKILYDSETTGVSCSNKKHNKILEKISKYFDDLKYEIIVNNEYFKRNLTASRYLYFELYGIGFSDYTINRIKNLQTTICESKCFSIIMLGIDNVLDLMISTIFDNKPPTQDFYGFEILKTKEIDFRYDLNSNNLIKELNSNKPKSKILIDGKELNISERYEIANKVLKLSDEVAKINCKAEAKHEFISIILGCNVQVSRNLFNGMHQKRTPVNNERINLFLNKLK